MVAAEMTQGHDGAAAQITQLHGESSPSLRHGGQQSAVATQGRLLLGAFDSSAGKPLDPRRASREGQERGKQCGCAIAPTVPGQAPHGMCGVGCA